MEYYTAERKKECLSFETAWMELESIMPHEMSKCEGQKPFDLSYNWNLINKTNKRAKYNQRHGNKEQIDSDQWGGGRGIMRKEGEGQVKEHV